MSEAADTWAAARPDIGLRSPDEVASLACMGAAHQHRLSFMRILLRRMKREGWSFARSLWELDGEGHGTAVYTAAGPERSYSLVAFSHDLDPAMRSDRVIATAWDATYALFDGVPSKADIERLRANVPLQEAGRVSASELSVSRTNRSVRLFDHVVARLSDGQQPDEALVDEVGYLMRTTAVYGSGKLGAADYDSVCERSELRAPFQAEMLSVYLTREFTLDLVEHIAAARSPGSAARLDPRIRRKFGVGNATGLGMAPFLVNHPMLLNAWFTVRETALMRVRALASASTRQKEEFGRLLARSLRGAASWRTADAVQSARIVVLAEDLGKLASRIAAHGLAENYPWDEIYRWADGNLSLEARELVASLLIEGHGDLVDDLEASYRADEAEGFRIDGSRPVRDVLMLLARNYRWAWDFDFGKPFEAARFWYTSEEKLEPRLGERWEEDGAALEQPLAIARDVQALGRALDGWAPSGRLAAFLMAHPEHRHVVRRIMLSEKAPYAEIRDNVISAGMRPIDILRFKLSCFGATRFDPRSDRWVRITMFQHAPCMDEIATAEVDDWFLPPLDDRSA
ncbi:hypothetical protein [Aestuariivirga sp.]|uniref:hypothetical protein n=1 Tax=Aestuariivirga sp. TaxID=2650926 RepID=UPI00391BF775